MGKIPKTNISPKNVYPKECENLARISMPVCALVKLGD